REPVVGAVAGDHGGGHRRVDLRVLGREAVIEARIRRQIALAGASAKERRYRHRGETRAKAYQWPVESHPSPPFPLSNRYEATAWRKHGGRRGLRRLISSCRQGPAAPAGDGRARKSRIAPPRRPRDQCPPL